METHSKDWLVRTRAGDILGPYTQRELLEAFQRRVFSPQDEIAPALGRWSTAQVLTNHDVDEATRTSTRSIAAQTRTKTATEEHSGSDPEQTVTPSFDSERTNATDWRIRTNPQGQALPQGQRFPTGPQRATPERSNSRFGPFMTLFFALAAAVAIVILLRERGTQTPSKTAVDRPNADTVFASDAETPFTRGIYDLIRRGEYKNALQKLTEYQERQAGRSEIDYLIPYAALLILEGESLVRAKRLLEPILASKASPKWKARAHHWLGYLALSQREADMGEGHFLEALQLNPKDAASRFNLGVVYLRQKRFSQALDYLQLAEIEMPDLWLIHVYKGRARAEMGQLDEAHAAFRTAVQLSPDRWGSYVALARFLRAYPRDREAAAATLRQMITRDPHYETFAPAPFGFFREATDFRDYLDAYDDSIAPGSGEEREAGRAYITYLWHGGDNLDGQRLELAAEKGGLFSRVIALKAALDRDAGADTLRIALNRLPPQLVDFGYYAYVLRGEARMRLDSFEDAQQDFQRALALEPRAAVAHWGMTLLLQKTQRLSAARQQLDLLLSYHPLYIPAIRRQEKL